MIRIDLYKHFWFLLLFALSVGFVGCKNQQKLAEEQAAVIRAENIAKAKAILNSILNDDGSMSIDEKENKLRQAKTLNSDDPEVLQLIAQVEDMISREREAALAVESPAPDSPAEEGLGALFGRIANSGNTANANELIEEGLAMFSSPDIPVLIIISESGGMKDYDEPTTIERYLNYLKDHQISPNQVYQVKKDDRGKISELELIKKTNR
jgi:hypothetical protein